MKCALWLLLPASLLGMAPAARSQPPECGPKRAPTRVKPQDAPLWVGALVVGTDQGEAVKCGAVVVADLSDITARSFGILTARHCLSEGPIGDIVRQVPRSIILGRATLEGATDIDKIRLPETIVATMEIDGSDLALFTVELPRDYPRKPEVLPPAEIRRTPAATEPLTFFSWGHRPECGETNRLWRQDGLTPTPMVGDDQWALFGFKSGLLGYELADRDSGGALVHNKTLIGILSARASWKGSFSYPVWQYKASADLQPRPALSLHELAACTLAYTGGPAIQCRGVKVANQSTLVEVLIKKQKSMRNKAYEASKPGGK